MAQETMEQKEKKNQEYNEYVKQVTPTHSLPAIRPEYRSNILML